MRALLAAALFAAGAAADGTPLTNARIEAVPASASASASGRLAAAVRAAESGAGPAWVGWTVPAAGRHRICCGSWNEGGAPCSSRCSLETSLDNFSISDSDDCPSGDSGHLVVFVKSERGRAPLLRLFSEDCAVDAAGARIAWLDRVPPPESVAFLESLVVVVAAASAAGRKDDELDRDPSSRAVAAIALHDDPSADAALDRFVSPSSRENVRKKTVFWLGSARGVRGYETLRRLAREESSDRVRKQVTFALSQSPVPAATAALIDMAKADSSAKVRGQALFWLAQKAGHRAADAIQDAIRDDPETEVKKKAVFALSQLPGGESATQLIRVARTNRNPEVRKQALFWLGQSKDPRALAYIEEVLTK